MAEMSRALVTRTPKMSRVDLKRTFPALLVMVQLALTFCSTTKNPNVSDEAKQSAEQRLKEMGQ